MTGEAAERTSGPLPDRFRAHFGHRQHLYGVLLEEMADDWEVGGVTRELFEGWEDAEMRQMPQLRLLAGLFRIVLRGEAPELVPFYPVLGGDSDPEEAWGPVRKILSSHVDELRRSLDVPPQTNEPARTVALLIGLSEAVRRTGLRRVRLLEPGASAGLGLLVDHYRFVGDGWTAGPEDSRLVIDGCGAAGFDPEPFQIVSRRGCDVAPVDVTTVRGGDHLRSFVWPWMTERHERLTGAIEVARQHPVTVDEARAEEWVGAMLSETTDEDVLTVVWHSVTRMYWPAEESEAVAVAIDEAQGRMAVAHVAMETPWSAWASVGAVEERDELPRIELDGEVLGTCEHHGPPVTLDEEAVDADW